MYTQNPQENVLLFLLYNILLFDYSESKLVYCFLLEGKSQGWALDPRPFLTGPIIVY